jgi:hypothetical protein
MEVLIAIINILLLLAIVASPIFILWVLNRWKTRYRFLAFMVIGVLVTASLTLIVAWWGDTSNHMLLSHYGYDFDDSDSIERFEKVSPENIERVKILRISIMGLGWPLRAAMTYAFYSPYLLILYLFTYLINYLVSKYRRVSKIY